MFLRIFTRSVIGGWVLLRFDRGMPFFFLNGLAMYIGAVTLFTEASCGDGSLAIFSKALANPSG